MTSLRTSPTSRRPRLEALEDRQLLSVTPVSYNPVTRAWVLRGDAASDTVTITDNGQGNATNISITTPAGVLVSPGPVTRLYLDMGAGDDAVTYDLRRALTPNGRYREIHLSLGDGNDRFTGYVRGVAAGASGLGVYVNAGAGDDTYHTSVTGGQAANTVLGLIFRGGAGSDSATLDYRGNIAAGALFWTNLYGNDAGLFNAVDGTNSITMNYFGDMDGRFQFFLDGSGGTDVMSARLNLAAGSSGVVGAATGSAVRGGAGADTLTLRVAKRAVDPVTPINLFVDGGAGIDTATVSKWAVGNVVGVRWVENLAPPILEG